MPKNRPTSLLTGLLFIFGPELQAQGQNWVQLTPTNTPSPIFRPIMATDTARNSIWLCRSSDLTMWEWQNSNWIYRQASASPPGRSSFALSYDASRQRVVLFGGYNGGERNDTWEWDGTQWAQRTPSAQPSARYNHAMAYDPQRNRTVLFGGIGNNGSGSGSIVFQDTWEWDGTNWAARLPANYPPPAWEHQMLYDCTTSRILMVDQGSSWAWNGTSWAYVGSTPANYTSVYACDTARGKLVMTRENCCPQTMETFEFNGASWISISSPVRPSARSGYGMAYDPGSQSVILFGGYNSANQTTLDDTWKYSMQGTLATVTASGNGCGPLPLTLSSVSRPIIGATQSTTISNAPNGVAFMALGFTNTSAGPFFLPLDLAGFGLTGGCTLFMDASINFADGCIATGPSTCTHALSIPNLIGMAGVPYFMQAWAISPGFNPAATIVSNYLSCRIGTY